MSWSLLDSGTVGFADGNGGHLYTFPGGAVSAGDLLILAVGSDTTVSTPSGWTLPSGASDVHNIGAYVFYKVAAGGETSVTITTSGNFETAADFARYGGAASSPVDAVASGFHTVSATTSPSVTTSALAQTGELSIGALMLGGLQGTNQTGITWSTGYTQQLNGSSGGLTVNDQRVLLADNRNAGTAAESPSVSWVGASNNQTFIVVTFEAAAGPTTVADSDTGSGADSSSLIVNITDTDHATAVDSAVALSASFTSTDTGAAAETASLASSFTSSDTAVGSDSGQLTASLSSSDSATGSDSSALSAALTGTDAGSAVDSGALAAQLTSTDTATAVDTATLTAALTSVDTATAVDVPVMTSFTDADTGTAADTSSLAAAVTGTDSGTAAETSSLAATVSDHDTATATETGRPVVPGTLTIFTAALGTRRWTAALTGRTGMWRIPSTSTEYLPVVITGAVASEHVDLAVVPRGVDEPGSMDWHPADLWDGSLAQLLIGPGTPLVLVDGMYQVFARVAATPELPVIKAEPGLVRIT